MFWYSGRVVVHGILIYLFYYEFFSPQEKLSKRRELLTEKMKAEQKEQEQIRNEEQKVLK